MKSLENLEDIYQSLCYYDKRNPLNVRCEEDESPSKKECYCDNCFYGRSYLANIIINMFNEHYSLEQDGST